jgi:YD repeat-containing protein
MVDTPSGAFFQSWIDYKGGDLDINIKFERTYNSRSNHKGWFGFGWCTDFETSLVVSESEITLKHCGDGKEIHFLKTGSVFKSDEEQYGKFDRKGAAFIRSYVDGTTETYSSDGKLNEIKKGSKIVSIDYSSNGTPKAIRDGGGHEIVVSQTAEGLISEITVKTKDEKGKPVLASIGKYQYKNGNLVSAQNAWDNVYQYDYDKDHNMVKATWPNKAVVNIGYNRNDWVESLSGTDICSEKYSYKVENQKKPAKYTVSIKKTCDKNVTFERSYTYSFSTDGDRTIAAAYDEDGYNREYKYDKNGNVIEFTDFRPGKSGIRKVVTKVARNKAGQIVSISSPFKRLSYSYKEGSSRDVVSEATIEQFVAGKVFDKTTYNFSYDENDQMIGFKDSSKKDGLTVFSYDEQGRVSKVIFKDKTKDVSIEIVYSAEDESPKGIKYNGKILPFEIYDKVATAKEIAAVELYYDFIRATALSVPTY